MSRKPIDRDGNDYSDYLLFEKDDEKGYCAINCVTGRRLKGAMLNGYRILVVFRKDNNGNKIRRFQTIAAWRCSTFIGLPPTKHHTADHIDRNKNNDTLANVRWACLSVQSSNRNSFINTGNTKPIYATRENDIRHYTGITEASIDLNININTLSKMLRTGKHTHSSGWCIRYQYIKEIPGERWKHYRKKTEVSDHGRVRKKVYGGYIEVILASKRTYLALMTNGRNVPLHLIVMELFGDLIERRKIDPKVQVDHIDEDTRNNHIGNLNCVSIADHAVKSHARAVEVKNRLTGDVQQFKSVVEATKFMKVPNSQGGKYAKQQRRHPLYDVRYTDEATAQTNPADSNVPQIRGPHKRVKVTDKDGHVLEFESRLAASKHFHVTAPTIGRYISENVLLADGSRFEYVDTQVSKRCRKRVRFVDANNNIMREFKTASAASKSLNIGDSVIRNYLKGKGNVTTGYRFEYIEDSPKRLKADDSE